MNISGKNQEIDKNIFVFKNDFFGTSEEGSGMGECV